MGADYVYSRRFTVEGRIISAGLKESYHHDIYITKEALGFTIDPRQPVQAARTVCTRCIFIFILLCLEKME